MTFGDMRHLIGKQVILTIAEDPELVEFTGRLLNLETYGDASIALADGRTLYVWPLLRIRETD